MFWGNTFLQMFWVLQCSYLFMCLLASINLLTFPLVLFCLILSFFSCPLISSCFFSILFHVSFFPFLFWPHLSCLGSFYRPAFSCCTLFPRSFTVCSCVVLKIVLYWKKECSCSFHWCFSSVCIIPQGILLILSVWVCSGVSLCTLSLTLMANVMQLNLNEQKVNSLNIWDILAHNPASYSPTKSSLTSCVNVINV